MKEAFLILMFVVGAAMGSFLTCQAWRLKNKLDGKKSLGKRSVCLSCKKQLKWYDNIPVISWLTLRGKCRYCGKKIGVMEILAEVLMGMAFVLVSLNVDIEGLVAEPSALKIISYVATLVLLMGLGFLAIYDGKWGELPNFALIISCVVAFIMVVLKYTDGVHTLEGIWGELTAVTMLGGLYLVLYLASQGKWVGNGDWILGVIAGLVLGNAWLALIALFISNALGTIVMYPFVRKQKDKRIHFGPFLVAGCVIVMSFADVFMSLIRF